MGRVRREELHRFQGHALTHALGRCAGGIADRIEAQKILPKLPCPICLGSFPLDTLDEDHAPQRAGQSYLGPAQAVVLTCRRDNQFAGGKFEKTAAVVSGVLEELSEDGVCPIHSPSGRHDGQSISVEQRRAVQLTDLRAAYLIAFATLGYRWAASPRLGNVREAIRKGKLDLASGDFDFICPDVVSLPVDGFTVHQVTKPCVAVLVTGARVSVLLPAHKSPLRIAGRIAQPIAVERLDAGGSRTTMKLSLTVERPVPWPISYIGPGEGVEKTWDAVESGTLFHYDRCDAVGHHDSHAVPRAELADILGWA